MKLQTLVDVHPWLKEIHKLGYIPIEGIYRHADALSRFYSPAVFSPCSFQDFEYKKAIVLLERYLGRAVRYFNVFPPEEIIWISIAVDSFCPYVAHYENLYKVSILHDVMSSRGVFGENNRKQFFLGAQNSDAFAYVSNYSKYKFKQYRREHISSLNEDSIFIPYSNFHRWEKLPESLDKIAQTSASIGSLYSRKNLDKVLVLAHWIDCLHYHIGAFKGECEEEIFEQSLNRAFHYLGPLGDEYAELLLSQVETFFMLSKEEGFSITPLEAIVCGVRRVIISDIPPHKEIYDPKEVKFIDPEFDSLEELNYIPEVSEKYRQEIFDKYNKDSVIKNLNAKMYEKFNNHRNSQQQ